MIHVGIDILPIAFDDVFTSTRQSKSISFGSETGIEKMSEEKPLSKFLCSYLNTHVLLPHTCPTLARYPTFVGQSRSRRDIPLQNAPPAPIRESRFHTHIPLPNAYPAYARVSRSCTRVLLTWAYPTLARLFFCWSWTTSQCLTDALILTVWDEKA